MKSASFKGNLAKAVSAALLVGASASRAVASQVPHYDHIFLIVEKNQVNVEASPNPGLANGSTMLSGVAIVGDTDGWAVGGVRRSERGAIARVTSLPVT